MSLLERTAVIVAVALLLRTSFACAAPVGHGIDCSPAPWPPRITPDALQLALTAQRDAPTGDAAAQRLLGSLYLFGLGVPKDRTAGTNWIEAATRTAMPRMPPTFSEMELFAILLNSAEEALPELVRQYGAAWGIARYKQVARNLLQALSGCR
jgi:TPR repeat protein